MSTAVPQAAQSSTSRRASLWVRELPFSLVLILTVLGVAYTSFSKRPIIGYWEILAPIIGLVCVGVGWQSVNDKAGRLRLIAHLQGAALARVPGRDEFNVVAERSEEF